MDSLSSSLCLAIVKRYRNCEDALERCVSAFFQNCPASMHYSVEQVSKCFQELLRSSGQMATVEVVDLTGGEAQQQQGNETPTKAATAKLASPKRQTLSSADRATGRVPGFAPTDEIHGNDDHLSTSSLDALSALVATHIQERQQRQLDEDAAHSQLLNARRKQRYQNGVRSLYVYLISSIRQSVLPVLITAAVIGYTTSTPSNYMHTTTTQAHEWYQEAARSAAVCLNLLWSHVAWR